ncbi:MAG: DUF308 domain-containing protein [Aestuariivita sp.]|uniref:HdeD family acid-resistance protein n=1 Tax=Aestuariivita sp. TaxID=1872407 RepID=UPI003BAEDF3F
MKDWLKFVVLGGLSVAFGVFVLGAPVVASLAVTTLTGILFLVMGGLQVAGGISGEGLAQKVFGIAMGLVMLFLGWSFVAHPLEGTISLALMVMFLLMASGIVRLVFSWRMRSTTYFWPMLISGAVSVLLAAYIWVNFDTASVSILGIMLGIELLFNGWGLIILGLFLRKAPVAK